VMRRAGRTLSESVRRPRLRRLFLESMGFDGVFAATRDYLQPVLAALALTLAATSLLAGDWSATQRTALLVGVVYFVLHLLSAAASRRSHRVSDAAGGEERAARWLWGGAAAAFGGLALAGWSGVLAGSVLAFVALHVLHNVWRPLLVSRFDVQGSAVQGASLLSIESQARRTATMIVAPLLGYAVDAAVAAGSVSPWWPAGLLGLACSLLFLARGRRPDAGNG